MQSCNGSGDVFCIKKFYFRYTNTLANIQIVYEIYVFLLPKSNKTWILPSGVYDIYRDDEEVDDEKDEEVDDEKDEKDERDERDERDEKHCKPRTFHSMHQDRLFLSQ